MRAVDAGLNVAAVCCMLLACRSVRDRRHSHHLQHHARYVSSTVHVCGDWRPVVQGWLSGFLSQPTIGLLAKPDAFM